MWTVLSNKVSGKHISNITLPLNCNTGGVQEGPDCFSPVFGKTYLKHPYHLIAIRVVSRRGLNLLLQFFNHIIQFRQLLLHISISSFQNIVQTINFSFQSFFLSFKSRLISNHSFVQIINFLKSFSKSFLCFSQKSFMFSKVFCSPMSYANITPSAPLK